MRQLSQARESIPIGIAVRNIIAKGQRWSDYISPAISVLQEGVEQLQVQQEELRKKIMFYWIQLQVLHRQAALCKESHRALVLGQRDVAEAALVLSQYLGRSLFMTDKNVFNVAIGTFPTLTCQEHS